MKLSPQQQFWQDPTVVPDEIGELPEQYRRACDPESYIGLGRVSDFLAEVVGAFLPQPASILELGCGVGRNLAVLKRDGYTVYGIEINPVAIDLASQFFPTVSGDIALGTVEELLPLFPSVDMILTQGFLMHVPYDNDFIFETIRHHATGYIVTCEVEHIRDIETLKFPRNMVDYFLVDEWQQLAAMHQMSLPGARRSTVRVFRYGTS